MADVTAGERPLRTAIDLVLAAARDGLDRLTPAQAWAAATGGAVPGAVVIERVHLEWRCDPASDAKVPEATGYDVRWIVLCDEGYSSSLAAASLRGLGLHLATDVIDGFRAWVAAGLPVVHPPRPTPPRLFRG
jgi:rhodanese-related sulfurtransferase